MAGKELRMKNIKSKQPVKGVAKKMGSPTQMPKMRTKTGVRNKG